MENNNCSNCEHCFYDYSTGQRDCFMDYEMTEDEIIRFSGNMENGCPYHKEEKLWNKEEVK